MRQVLLGSGLLELTDAKSMHETGIVQVLYRPGESLVSVHVDVDGQARRHGAPACCAHNERRCVAADIPLAMDRSTDGLHDGWAEDRMVQQQSRGNEMTGVAVLPGTFDVSACISPLLRCRRKLQICEKTSCSAPQQT